MSTWSNTTVCSECGYLHLGKSHVCLPSTRPEPDCRTCKWMHQPGDSPIAGCFSHGRCVGADCYEPLPVVQLWRTAP